MNEDITKAAILLNAARIPYEIFIKLCENYNPSEIFTGSDIWEKIGLTFPQQKRLSELLLKDSWIEKEMEKIEKIDARFITALDLDYPVKLKDLKKPPVGLYVKGKADLNFPSVGIVGTRKCSLYGQNIASGVARALAHAGIITISGGARGIDAAAHRGSLSGEGITFAVFGTGLDRAYPSEHRGLFERILEKGAIISEYPMGIGGDAWHFPERNRLIVGMSGRIIIIESPEGGGAMITANEALEIGREIWAVPGRINEDVCKGTNRLIKDGANALINIEEFIEDISGRYGQLNINMKDSQVDINIKKQPELSDHEKKVYTLIQRQGNRTTDEILSETGLDLIIVQSAILSLEAEGLIISNAGRYSASV